MEKRNDIKYAFVILGPTDNPLVAIKTILFEKKIVSKNGMISFYAPYNKLYTSYREHFGNTGMWGLGFSRDAMNKHMHLWYDGQTPALSEDDGLKCHQVKKSEIEFSGLDRGDYFFVAPKMGEWKEIWFHGLKPGTEYKQWWCKGIHGGCCPRHEDEEIAAYLDEKKKSFFWKNYVEGEKDVVFQKMNMLFGDDELNHDYNLLGLTPKELHEGSRKEADVTGQRLF